MNAARKVFVEAVHQAAHALADSKCCASFDEAVAAAMDELGVEPRCAIELPAPAGGEAMVCGVSAVEQCGLCEDLICAIHVVRDHQGEPGCKPCVEAEKKYEAERAGKKQKAPKE